MSFALAVGLAPALPLLLVAVAFVVMYAVVSVVAVLATIGRVLRAGSDVGCCLDDLYGWIVNAPIALLTLTPMRRPARRPGGASRKKVVEPLPAVPPDAVRNDDEPVYWRTFQSRSARPGGARDDVILPGEPVTGLAAPVGRHARPEREKCPVSFHDDPAAEGPVRVGSSTED